MQDSDEQLMQRFTQGDEAAFGAVYARHKDALYGYLLRQVGRQSAEELFQQTWERVIKAGHGFEQRASFKTWLFSIARNATIDQHRRFKPVDSLSEQCGDDLVEPAQGPEDSNLRDERIRRVRHCLSRLPWHQREAVLLREAGHSVKQLALLIEVKFETAKSRLKLAHQQLKQCLEGMHD